MLKKLWIKLKKWIIGLFVTAALAASLGQVVDLNPVPIELQLKTEKVNLLGSKVIGNKEFIVNDIEEVKPAVEYIYKTHKIENELDEIVSKRTGISKTFKLNQRNDEGQEMYKDVIYSGPPQMYKNLETEEWFQAERAITTKEAFEKETKENLVERVIGFFGQRAMATDTTFYPDPSVESTTVDGTVRHYVDAGDTWNNVVNAAGTNFSDNSSSDDYIKLLAGVSNKWRQITRSIHLFDLSSLSGATVSAATFSAKDTARSDGLSATPDVNIYSSAPASNTVLAGGDYDSLGTAAYSTAVTYSGWSGGAYDDFVFNADPGIVAVQAAVDGDGILKLGARNASYDVADELDPGNHTPNWVENADSKLAGYMAEQTGTASDPKLVVTYTSSTARRVIIID